MRPPGTGSRTRTPSSSSMPPRRTGARVGLAPGLRGGARRAGAVAGARLGRPPRRRALRALHPDPAARGVQRAGPRGAGLDTAAVLVAAGLRSGARIAAVVRSVE